MLHIGLYARVGEFTSNKTLSIEYSVVGIHCGLGFGSISDKTFSLRECDVRWCGTVTLVVGNDFDTVILPYSNTGIGGSEINSNGFSSYSSHGFG
mmetsp:Transcript_24780/g.31167  ORF Transcript_24780/g.31167 Transcript_24780/m.31167 type:complete len:95 (+) Transcript_24780:432-716(+)